MPLTDTDSDDERASTTSIGTTQSAPTVSSVPLGKGAKAKRPRPKVSVQKDHLDDLCDINQAIRVYPQSEGTLKETGIPEHLLVQRELVTTGKGSSLYLCRHELCLYPAYYAQSPAGLYSHVRRKHLGMVIACPYCVKKLYWNSKGWHTHMDKHHQGMPHYGHQITDESKEAASLLVQLKTDPGALKGEAVRQERQLRKGLHPVKKAPTVTFKGSDLPPATTTPQPPQTAKSSESEDEDYPLVTEDTSPDSSSSTSFDSDADQPKDKEPTSPLPSATPAAQLASSLVLMDVDPNMPELEKTPPRPFPKRRKKEQE